MTNPKLYIADESRASIQYDDCDSVELIAVSYIKKRIKELETEINNANEKDMPLLAARWKELKDLISKDK